MSYLQVQGSRDRKIIAEEGSVAGTEHAQVPRRLLFCLPVSPAEMLPREPCIFIYLVFVLFADTCMIGNLGTQLARLPTWSNRPLSASCVR